MKNSVSTVLHHLIAQLRNNYETPEATSIAWELISFVAHKTKTELLSSNIIISDSELAQLIELLKKHLVQHVPIAYLTGTVQFGALQLSIRPPILIPRSETEQWCYRLIDLLKPLSLKSLRILDLCIGSGCIALALAHAFPNTTVVGIDIDDQALALARENSQRLNITNCTWIKSDLFENLDTEPNGSAFDIIVTNPPYIGHAERETLTPSVRNFESARALFADDHGYAIIKKIIAAAPCYIRPNPVLTAHNMPQLFIEIGSTQAKMVETFMHMHEYATIQTWKDYQGHDRVICARVPVCTTHKKLDAD